MKKHDLEKFLHGQIPIAKHLGARVERVDDSGVLIKAPLEANKNHMGTAFGGSLHAVLVLACYTWLYYFAEKQRMTCHLVLKSSECEYLKPVSGPLVAECTAPNKEDLERFVDGIKRKGLARVHLEGRMLMGTAVATRFHGEFVAKADETDSLL